MNRVDLSMTGLDRLALEASATGRRLQAAVISVHRLDHWTMLRGEVEVDRALGTADAVLRTWASSGRFGLAHAEQRRPGTWAVLRLAAGDDDPTAWAGSVAYQLSSTAALRRLTHGVHLLSMAVSAASADTSETPLQMVRRLTVDALAAVDVGVERDGRDLREVDEVISALALTNVVQPIVRLDGGVGFGFEVLTRGPRGHRLESPLALFQAASGSLLAAPLEAAAIDAAMARAAELPPGQRIFVNLDPVLASDPRFVDHLGRAAAAAGARPAQVVIELVERSPLDGLGSFGDSLARYREMGFALAIDDVGAAHSSLQRIVTLHPDVIKVDRSLIAGCDRDASKRSMLGFLTQVGWSIGALVLAEGVETVAELGVVKDLGMDLIQGYLIGRPAAAMTAPDAAAQQLLGSSDPLLTVVGPTLTRERGAA